MVETTWKTGSQVAAVVGSVMALPHTAMQVDAVAAALVTRQLSNELVIVWQIANLCCNAGTASVATILVDPALFQRVAVDAVCWPICARGSNLLRHPGVQ